MSLHNLTTTLTPEEHDAMSDLLSLMRDKVIEGTKDEQLKRDYLVAVRWLAAQSEKFFQEWKALPDGSHLKAAYEDMVWKWSDRDLEAMPEADLGDLNFVRPTNDT